ncbi:DUF1385 domain-containing protein [Pseudoneobacillus sp. C159]
MNNNELLINGGMAHSNAVSFYGKNYQSKAIRKKKGEIEVVVEPIKALPQWLNRALRIPLVRGFADTIYGFYMKWFIGFLFMVAPILMNYRIQAVMENIKEAGTDRNGFIFGLLTGLLMVTIMLKVTPMGKYHAAEHVMHNLYLQGRPITVEEGTKASRIHEWCGTSCMAILIVYTALMAFVPIPVWLKILIWFPFYGEVIMNENKFVRTIFMPFKLTGYAFQLLTTSKPKEEHLEVSRQAFQRLLEKEQALVKKGQTA